MEQNHSKLVSIILTTLNSEAFLERSIESCLAQTHTDIELIVVDGGSQDRTLEILAGIDDPRLRIIHQPENRGRLPGAINLGMSEARGAFITWTQDDCWYEPSAIAEMLMFLSCHSEIGLVYSDFWFVDLESGSKSYYSVKEPNFVNEDDVVQQCFLFRREVYAEIGPQDERYFPVHEVPWRIRVAEKFGIAPFHRPLQYYGRHAHSLSGRIGGWMLQRHVQTVLYEDGWIDKREMSRRLAGIYIDEAYAAFVRESNFGKFRLCWIRAILKDPVRLFDLGTGKMLFVSFFPQRNRVQQQMKSAWLDKREAQQRELIRRHESPGCDTVHLVRPDSADIVIQTEN